jgi:hypothetical protein
MDPALRELVEETVASEHEKRVLSGLAERLHRLPSRGLANKLTEYRGRRAEALIAELRMAWALSNVTRLGVELQAGAAHDLRLRGQGLDWTVEVQHKSSVDPFSAIFNPEPDLLAAYEGDEHDVPLSKSQHRECLVDRL